MRVGRGEPGGPGGPGCGGTDPGGGTAGELMVAGWRSGAQHYGHHGGVEVDKGFRGEVNSPWLPDGWDGRGTGVVLDHLE